jgi:hypothetical protein
MLLGGITDVCGLNMKTGKLLVIVLVSAIALFYTQYGMALFFLHQAINLGIGLYCIVAAIRSLRSGNWSRFAYIIFCAVLLVGALYSLRLDRKYHWIYLVDLKIQQSKYENCKRDGVVVNDGEILSVCSRNTRWEGWGFIETVVYDSGGEVTWSSGKQSSEWRRAANSLDRQAPFGILGFDVVPLVDHFYLVTFYDDLPSTF